ncbi:MAG: TonB family protein [Myxococcota bacterium]
MTTVHPTTPDPSTTRMQKDWRDGANSEDGDSGRVLFPLCCLLSALLHVLVFVAWPPRAPAAQLKRPPAPTISYRSVAPNTVQQSPPRQVVTTPPPRKRQRPAHADLLAEWDTATKNPRKKVGRLLGSSPESRDAIHRVSTTVERSKTEKNHAHRDDKASERGPRKVSNEVRTLRGKNKAAPRLFPSWRELRLGVTGSPDDLPDIPPGDFVQLNTVQWRHAAFFNRMKESVVAAWHPQRRLNRHNPNGLGMQGRHHETVVRVTIDRGGNLVRARLTRRSGFAYLDDEALTAFHLAQPFPHPPQALFGTRQRFSFHAVLAVHVRHGGFY